jgi:RNA polymerase sigma-70 factor (ECF subfamily)
LICHYRVESKKFAKTKNKFSVREKEGDDNMTEMSLSQNACTVGYREEYSEPEVGTISRCATDKAALEQLYVKYKASVFAFSLGLYNNRTIAEDCVQETFIRLPSAASGYKPGGSELSYILGIAKNVSRELYKSEMKFRAGAAKMEAESPFDVAPQTGVLEIVRRLPKRYRVALMLKAYCGLTFREMSSLLKVSESTLKSRYYKAVNMAYAEFMKCNQSISDNKTKDFFRKESSE